MISYSIIKIEILFEYFYFVLDFTLIFCHSKIAG